MRLKTSRLCASVLVCCWTIAACSASESGGPSAATGPAPRIAAVHWRLWMVEGPDGSTRVPNGVDGWLELAANGSASGSDGCGTFQASSHGPDGNLRLSRVSETANGCLSDHGPLDATRNGVYTALLSGHPTRVTMRRHRLRVSGSGYVLTYVSQGPTSSSSATSPGKTTTSGGLG